MEILLGIFQERINTDEFYRDTTLSLLIDYLWSKHRKYHMVVFVFFSAFMGVLSVFASATETDTSLGIATIVFAVFFLKYEMIIMFSNGAV